MASMPRKKKLAPFTAEKEVKALSREQIGIVKATRVETPKSAKKPKYPPKLELD